MPDLGRDKTGARQPIQSPGARGIAAHPDWRSAEDYQALLQVDRRAFAWEWLRRTHEYRMAWSRRLEVKTEREALRFGLERFEDPDLPVPYARPIWSALADPGVVAVRPNDLFAPPVDRVDLYQLNELVSLTVDEAGDEHLLLSDGWTFVRLDVIEGSLIGTPCSLFYLIEGAASANEGMATVRRLVDLMARKAFRAPRHARSLRHERWIAELRVADALKTGANQHEIARVLFGDNVPDTRWRVAAAPFRRRVQRLVAEARARQRAPTDRRWFRTPWG